MHFVGWRVIIKRIKAIRFMMADKTVSKWKKLLVILGIIYLFLPLDLIPPVLFPFGFVDDIILWLAILYYLRNILDSYWMGEKPRDYSGKYKDAMETEDYEVNVEGEEEIDADGEYTAAGAEEVETDSDIVDAGAEIIEESEEEIGKERSQANSKALHQADDAGSSREETK